MEITSQCIYVTDNNTDIIIIIIISIRSSTNMRKSQKISKTLAGQPALKGKRFHCEKPCEEDKRYTFTYNLRERIYCEEGVSQFLISFLRNMIQISKTIGNSKEAPILSDLIKICKRLHLNEMEIALWSLHVDIAKWDLQQFQLSDCLLFSAFIAKEQLCEDAAAFEIYYEKVFSGDPSTLESYRRWRVEYPIRPTFSAPQINLQFDLLRNPSQKAAIASQPEPDLNKTVDEILKGKLAHPVENKKKPASPEEEPNDELSFLSEEMPEVKKEEPPAQAVAEEGLAAFVKSKPETGDFMPIISGSGTDVTPNRSVVKSRSSEYPPNEPLCPISAFKSARMVPSSRSLSGEIAASCSKINSSSQQINYKEQYEKAISQMKSNFSQVEPMLFDPFYMPSNSIEAVKSLPEQSMKSKDHAASNEAKSTWK